MKKYTFLIFIIISMLLLGCIETGKDQLPQKENNPSQSKCGDGICDSLERESNLCPEDCHNQPPKNETVKSTPDVVYIGMMVHLEGWADETDESAYIRHVGLMREYADLFEKYGAKLTWESKELTKGSLRWGDNVLLEMQERGHGVGVHADVGGSRNYVCKNFTSDLATKKKELEQLGVNVRHVSGVTSHCDWVTACVESGFKFTTGGVAYSVSSLPEELRPEQFKNCPSPSKCHQPYPTSLTERLHPWRARSGTDWIIDNPDGKLVILAESGLLVAKYEESISSDISNISGEFTREDIDTYFRELEQAIALSDPDKVNIYYVGGSLGKPLDKVLLGEWLKRIQPYVENGSVRWATLPEMYDAYVNWEK